MNDISLFLKQRPLISIRGLEKQCGIPIGTIRLSGRGIPFKYEAKLREALMPYGLNQVSFIEAIRKESTKVQALIDDNTNLWRI